jgi:pimeloyl-ACP methyl ester carboxylesterase
MEGTVVSEICEIETAVREAALQYITPGGTRKVVRRPRTEIVAKDILVPYRDGHVSTRVWAGSFRDPGDSVREDGNSMQENVDSDNELVLLVHGWAANQTDMFSYIPPLLERGFAVVAMDLPAHGESSFDTAGLNHLGDGVLAVAKHYGHFHGVIAHSVGCAASQLAIADGMNVSRAVMLASPVNYEKKAYEFAATKGFNEATSKQFVDALADLDVRVAIRSKDFVPSFDMPALIVHSEDDAVIPVSIGRELAALWKDSEFLSVDGLNHRGVLKDAFVISKVVEFLCSESA